MTRVISDYLYVADIVPSTTADGPGMRTSVYVAGCGIHCPGCHNPQLWKQSSGKKMEVKQLASELLENRENITILGGEPLMQPRPVYALMQELRRRRPQINIWLYTGYFFDTAYKRWPELFELVNVVVAGPYLKKYRDTSLLWKGSKNQRIIFLQ